MESLGNFRLSLGVHQHDHTRGSLGLSTQSQLNPASDEDVGNFLVLALNWEMGDDVHGRDICCKNDYTFESLANGLADLLDSSLHSLDFNELSRDFEELLFQLFSAQGLGDGTYVELVSVDQNFFHL